MSHFAASCQGVAAVHSPPAFPQIKPDKINIPFWQVLEADGEGDLMVVAGYSSGASVSLGDSAHDG